MLYLTGTKILLLLTATQIMLYLAVTQMMQPALHPGMSHAGPLEGGAVLAPGTAQINPIHLTAQSVSPTMVNFLDLSLFNSC